MFTSFKFMIEYLGLKILELDQLKLKKSPNKILKSGNASYVTLKK